jgi:cullin-associated NEDD8-dissociated protein 1
MKANLAKKFKDLNGALTSFVDEMKAQGTWDSTSLVITSDFGRTLTANSGEGSDHAWGGNYFIAGGSVKGGRIHGDYPADITKTGPLNIGRGRLIPTMSWESILNSCLEWMGVADEELDYCLPNRIETGTKLFKASEVFETP